MYRIGGAIFLLVFSFFLGWGSSPVLAQEEPEFELKAEAALLMETHSGELIWEMEADKRLYPASLTKIMSLLLVMEQLEAGKVSLEDRVTVSARASSMGGSELFLSEGDELSLEELIIGMAVGSANDGAIAVAEYIGGSVETFVEMMNEKARQLGLKNTHFCNPHGLHHPDHYSSARDIAVMSCALLEHPKIHNWSTIWMDEHFLKGKIKSGEVFLSNTNRMILSYPGCDGLKTGYTREAGNGISATAKRGGTRFLAVVLGSPTVDDRYEAARTLLDYGFAHYKSITLHEKGAVVTEIPLEKSVPSRIQAVAGRRAALLLPRGAEEKTEEELVLKPITLPLGKGQQVGELRIRAGEVEASFPLVAAQGAVRASQWEIFSRLLEQWVKFGR